MGPNTSAYDREEDALVEEFNSGQITRSEFDRAMRDLQQDYRDAAHDAARDAYERELEQW